MLYTVSIWKAVLNFANLLVLNFFPEELKNNLKLVINMSLSNITKNIQTEITEDNTGKNKNDRKADKIKSLSASGSKNFPKFDTTLYFLAKKPS